MNNSRKLTLSKTPRFTQNSLYNTTFYLAIDSDNIDLFHKKRPACISKILSNILMKVNNQFRSKRRVLRKIRKCLIRNLTESTLRVASLYGYTLRTSRPQLKKYLIQDYSLRVLFWSESKTTNVLDSEFPISGFPIFKLYCNEKLALDDIKLVDNDFVNTDTIGYHVAQVIMKIIGQTDYCRHVNLETMHEVLISRFACEMGARSISHTNIEKHTIDFKKEQNNQEASNICDVLINMLRTYSSDYSTSDLNGATLVRDTIENLFKVYFPNTTLTKSIGADVMIRDSSKRFTDLDPSLTKCGKRADFSVISSKSNHVLLSLKSKSNKTKGLNDLIKLCHELKDTIKVINSERRSGVVLCGILMKGNSSDVYCMDHVCDGLYRVILLKRMYLPRGCYEMHQLSSILPLFQKLKTIVHASALILRNSPSDVRILTTLCSRILPRPLFQLQLLM